MYPQNVFKPLNQILVKIKASINIFVFIYVFFFKIGFLCISLAILELHSMKKYPSGGWNRMKMEMPTRGHHHLLTGR